MSETETKNRKISNETLDYYNKNARIFFDNTQHVDFSALQNLFMSKVAPGGLILDLGCGSGRDSLAFLQHGYQIIAVDGSKELCSLASETIGQEVICTDFRYYQPDRMFDGIWACASLLHLPADDIRTVIARLIDYLKPGGCFYMSFKYGDFSGMRNGRYFTDLTEKTLTDLLPGSETIKMEDMFTTGDVREGRTHEKWLNVFLKKVK